MIMGSFAPTEWKAKLSRLAGAAVATVALTTIVYPAPPAQAIPACTVCYELQAMAQGSGLMPPIVAKILKPILDPVFSALVSLPVDALMASNPATATVYSQNTSALSFTFPSTTLAVPLNGSAVTASLTPGTWRIEVSGQYQYDTNFANVYADANCSLPHPQWRDVRDGANDATTGAPATVRYNGWHADRYRLGYYTTQGPGSLRTFAFPTDDVLGVYVDGQPVPWQPTDSEGPVDANGNQTDLACNTIDHTYSYDVTVLDPTTISLSVFDVYYPDNAPVGAGLTAKVTRQLPLG